MLNDLVPLVLLTDSYKASHFRLYPEARKMVAYGEFRQSFEKDPEDSRILFYGLRYLIENYVAKRWTMEMVEQSARFFATHNAGYTDFPFPRHLFEKFITENDGWFPVKIEAPLEGSVVYPHVPVYQITATDEYSSLCTWLETLLTMLWYPVTVATLSRRAKQLIRSAFDKSVDAQDMWLLDSRLHDFGFRGCTSVEQSIIGGSAHLVNFTGCDTMSAAYYVQFHLNNGKPVGLSIPATEHSVMTAWPSEREAMLNLIEKYGTGVFACVMDSYDYMKALNELVPAIAQVKLQKGGMLILRPDSGDPVETVVMALQAAEKEFGVKKNAKGFKVINGCAVIQGDGVNPQSLEAILEKTLSLGYSAQNVAFGMGGGLLQKVNRDTMSFATKLCQIHYKESKEAVDIMKMPKTDSAKNSLPGELCVYKNPASIPIVYPKESELEVAADKTNIQFMSPVYDHGKICRKWQTFDEIRERAEREWNSMPKHANVISQSLQKKIDRTAQKLRSIV